MGTAGSGYAHAPVLLSLRLYRRGDLVCARHAFCGEYGETVQKCRGETPSLVRRIGAAALSVAVYFVAVTVLSTLLELIVGLIFMKGLGIPLWSYKNFDHTFMDIICLDFSLLWGVLITVGMCTLWPFLQFLERKLSPKARAVAAIVARGGSSSATSRST